tara:strand:- start:966 stop:1718 length:753 start_codon:yes stop_codon:yes gene_type:complete
MKYALVIGIEYKKYKKPAEITISIDNTFIDTFQLHDDLPSTDKVVEQLDETWFNELGYSHWLTGDDWQDRWKDKPRLYKVYLLEEKHINDRLSIKVENSNSDFTNGFMKKSSMIKFPIIGLVPYSFLKNKAEKLMRIMIKFSRAQDHGTKLVKIINGEVSRRQPTSWPTANSMKVQNRNELYQKNGLKKPNTWIGGSFEITIPIRKKYNIKYLGNTLHKDQKDIGYWVTDRMESLILGSCKQLLNMYDED